MDGVHYLLDLAIILFAAKLFSTVGKNFGIPGVVGEILAGLVIGPAVLGVVKETDFLRIMADIGVIMLMFEAGLGTDLQELKNSGLKAALIACAGVIVSLLFGTVLYMSFYGFGAVGSELFMKAIFIGTITTATSVSISVAALKELGKLSSKVGTAIMSAAMIDDIIGIILLTIVMGFSGGRNAESVSGVMLKVGTFFAGAIVTGFIVYKAMSWLDGKYTNHRRMTITSLCYCFLLAYVSDTYFGLSDITGAYLAGVVLCNLSSRDYIESKVDISSYMIFAPIFFAGIGLKTTFGAMDFKLMMFSVCFVIAALAGKIIGCGGCARLTGFDSGDSLKIGAGMMTRGEVALITAQKGLLLGLISADYFTAVILMILASSFATPVMLKKLYER